MVIGGGPGGYVAAIRAAQLGMRTGLVEREHLGGICLNWGCIPTKALLRSAEIFHLMHHIGDFGFSAKELSYDFAKVVKRSRQVAGQLNRGVQHLLKKNKVTVLDGQGRLDGKRSGRGREGRQDHGHDRGAAHHPRDRRPGALAAGPRAGRQADLDLQGSDGAAGACRSPCW